jgi:hypothetical protein
MQQTTPARQVFGGGEGVQFIVKPIASNTPQYRTINLAA